MKTWNFLKKISKNIFYQFPFPTLPSLQRLKSLFLSKIMVQWHEGKRKVKKAKLKFLLRPVLRQKKRKNDDDPPFEITNMLFYFILCFNLCFCSLNMENVFFFLVFRLIFLSTSWGLVNSLLGFHYASLCSWRKELSETSIERINILSAGITWPVGACMQRMRPRCCQFPFTAATDVGEYPLKQ